MKECEICYIALCTQFKLLWSKFQTDLKRYCIKHIPYTSLFFSSSLDDRRSTKSKQSSTKRRVSKNKSVMKYATIVTFFYFSLVTLHIGMNGYKDFCENSVYWFTWGLKLFVLFMVQKTICQYWYKSCSVRYYLVALFFIWKHEKIRNSFSYIATDHKK